MFNKLIITFVLALTALSTTHAYASEIIADTQDERITVSLKNLKICHQHAWRNLSVGIDYLGENIDVEDLRTYIKGFLSKYSEMDDFWEVMNVKLVKEISEAFPTISKIESTLSLQPDPVLIFPRGSTVKFDRDSEVLKERFSFTKRNYLICQETFRSLDMHVGFDFKDNPTAFDYPDYRWVDEAMNAFFKEHPVSFTKWTDLRPLLEEHLLREFPSLATIMVTVSYAN